MLYKEFVKENYAKVKHLPANERMGAIAQMWRKYKSGNSVKSKGAGIFQDIGSKLDDMDLLNEDGGKMKMKRSPAKRGRKAKKSTKGSGLIDGLVSSIFGGELPAQSHMARAFDVPFTTNGTIDAPRTSGSGFFDDFMSGLSHGLSVVPQALDTATKLAPYLPLVM